MITDDVIKSLCDLFRKTFKDFKGMYLFGLFLDGKSHDGEDIELVAIFEQEDKSKREEIWRIIGKVESDLDVCIDLYPYTPDEFKNDEEIYNEVIEEGIFYDTFGTKQNRGN